MRMCYDRLCYDDRDRPGTATSAPLQDVFALEHTKKDCMKKDYIKRELTQKEKTRTEKWCRKGKVLGKYLLKCPKSVGSELMSGNTSSLLGDATTGIVSNVKCGFGGEVVIWRVFTMWFCPRIRILALTRSRMGLGGRWFFSWWVSMLGWLILHPEMSERFGGSSDQVYTLWARFLRQSGDSGCSMRRRRSRGF